jgi:8-oxo-dGTP pyrophosphatase MutT (NUDIX family)
MPGKYVFPGGRVDAADRQVACADALAAAEEQKLLAGMKGVPSADRARAIALAAVRETYEEAGLLVGRRGGLPPTRARAWAPFAAHGVAPALDLLEYVARAITPPGSHRRFDTRFFWVDAEHAYPAAGSALTGSGELLHLRWVPLAKVDALDLPEATRMVVGEVAKRLAARDPRTLPVPFARYTRGSVRLDWL